MAARPNPTRDSDQLIAGAGPMHKIPTISAPAAAAVRVRVTLRNSQYVASNATAFNPKIHCRQRPSEGRNTQNNAATSQTDKGPYKQNVSRESAPPRSTVLTHASISPSSDNADHAVTVAARPFQILPNNPNAIRVASASSTPVM